MGARILLIEDHPVHAELACALLRRAGHEVLGASTSSEGIALAKSWRPDLVLCDLVLNGRDATEGTFVVCELKVDPALEYIPVVAISALDASEEKLIAAGFAGFIPKPIDPERFAAQLARYIPRKPA
jgi:two-component system, cell cycle response regulator